MHKATKTEKQMQKLMIKLEKTRRLRLRDTRVIATVPLPNNSNKSTNTTIRLQKG